MKKINIKLVTLCTLLLILTGCTSYVEDLNVDPDNLTDSDASNLFQGVLLANQFFQTSSNTRDVMIWLNQANGEDRQYVALNNWNNSAASSFDDSWNNAYVNTITQAKITSSKAITEGSPRLAGAAQVVEAHCIGTVTSLWGDVPYSELDIQGKNLTPKFDPQASVYASIQKLLDNAIANLKKTTGPGIPSSKDIYYNGDTAKWLQLAYSLKARYYIHTKNYPLAKTNAILGINSIDGDLKAQFKNSYGQSFNPYYSFLVYDRDSYMSGDSYAARLLDPSESLYRGNSKTDESARFIFTYLNNGEYFDPYTLNIYSEDYFGSKVGAANELPDGGKFGSDSNIPLVTYGEMLLIISEVDARTSVATGVSSYNVYRNLLNTGYSIGVRDDNDKSNQGYYDGATHLSFSYQPYTVSDFLAGGIENTSPVISQQDALLREIFQERYIYFMGTYETLNDFARSNNMANIQLKTGYTGTPQRLLYPQVEVNANPKTPNPIPKITVKTPIHN